MAAIDTIDELVIAGELKGKVRLVQGELASAVVARGEAEIKKKGMEPA